MIGDKINSTDITETLKNLGRFSDKDLTILSLHLKECTLTKDQQLINEGKICQSIYFVKQGSLHRYQICDSGEMVTKDLYVENDWVLDYKSFIAQSPSESIIQAMENCQLLELSVFDLHKLMKISDVFFQVARIFQYGLSTNDNQIKNLTPKEKYLHLLTHKPEVIQRFPLKFIASFLGIAPETLSRVRRSVSC